jgi:hypothetical protein
MYSCMPGLAQVSLFEESIPAKDLPSQVKLLQQQDRHYLSTRYARQQFVPGKHDYLIRLSDDLQVLSRFKFMHRYPAGSLAYEGIIEGPLAGHVVLSAYADRVAGMITFDDGRRYLIDQPADGIFAISQSSESAFAAQEQLNDYVEPPTTVGKNAATLANADVCNVNNTCTTPPP